MKAIRNLKVLALVLVGAVSIILTSCNDDLDIQQSYPFTVETMPVPKALAYGETAEIRCELKCDGDYANTLYTIRYFQYDGEGTLCLEDGTVLKPNDRYLLQDKKFHLYYTSECDKPQNFIVVVEDNFGNSYEMEFDFNVSDEESSATEENAVATDVLVPNGNAILTQ